MPFDAVFNANEVKPQQSGGAHPVGNKFPFTITNTVVEPTKDNNGGKFVVELTSTAGSIKINYNLWNQSEQARNISKGQLSALCHATGIFQIDFKNDGVALRGGAGLMDVGFQKGQEPSAEKPEGGYVEVKKIYDKNGNDPTQGGSGQQQSNQPTSGFAQQPQNNQQQNNAANQTANWNTGNQPQQAAQNTMSNNQQSNVQQGWNNGGQQSNQPDPNQNQQQQQGGGWNASNQTQGNTPPWQK